MTNFRNYYRSLSSLIFASLLAAIIIVHFPLTSATSEQPTFNAQLQFHRQYPLYSNQVHRWKRISGEDMPFWLRRKSPTSNKIKLKIQNQRLLKYQRVISEASLEKEDHGLHHSQCLELKSESSRKNEKMNGGNRKQEKTSLSSMKIERMSYDSYRKFNPDQYVENSPKWQKSIYQYILDMRKNGHYIQEVNINKHKHQREVSQNRSPNSRIQNDPIICKLGTFRLCYSMEKYGTMRPIGNRRRVRQIRV